jgi:DNA-binding HxlR family transcriptional regulator
MDRREHIHIISAGESIHKSYPAVIGEIGKVTHTFIFAEKEVYTDSPRDDAQRKAWKCGIRDAISAVNTHSRSQDIACALLFIEAGTFESVRDSVLSILIDHPDAKYSFDISAGSKRLSLALLAMSVWVEGDSYYAFGNSPARRVPVPALSPKSLLSNPYHLVILAILFRGREDPTAARIQLPGETLFNEVKGWHVPARDTASEDSELSPKTFSRLLSALAGWRLISEESDPENEHVKLYSITPDGETALFVFSARQKRRHSTDPPGLM